MTNQDFFTVIAALVPELEKLVEYAIGVIDSPDTSDPAAEHQLALNLIRKVQDAQAKKDVASA